MPETKDTFEWMDKMPRRFVRVGRWAALRKTLHGFKDTKNFGKMLKIGNLSSREEAWSAMGAVHDEARRYLGIGLSTSTYKDGGDKWALFVIRKPDIELDGSE